MLHADMRSRVKRAAADELRGDVSENGADCISNWQDDDKVFRVSDRLIFEDSPGESCGPNLTTIVKGVPTMKLSVPFLLVLNTFRSGAVAQHQTTPPSPTYTALTR